MQNVKMVSDGKVLTITVDLGAPTSRSASGKSEIVATTSGNANVPNTNGVKIGLNIYKPVA